MPQWFNLDGILAVARCAWNPQLLVPHLSIRDIREVDFAALRRAGCAAIVWDKDNTLTLPYGREVPPQLTAAWESCRQHFDGAQTIVSNSAGTASYDPQGAIAREIEDGLRCRVLRHTSKKPTLPESFKRTLHAPRTAVIGDRVLTDIVMGNSLGAMTVLTQPLSLENDNRVAILVRKLEARALTWLQRRYAPAAHPLMAAYNEELKKTEMKKGR